MEITEGVSSNHLVEEHQQQTYKHQQVKPGMYYDPDLQQYREYQGTRVTQARYGRDNVPTDRPDPSRVYTGRRRKRDLSDIELQSLENCKATKCLPIRCTVGPLKKNQTVYIGLRARVNVRTLRNVRKLY